MAEKTYCKLQYCMNDCHVMSCHVAIVVSILKNHSQKLFHFTKLFINILQASLLVLIKLSHSPKASRRNEDLKNPRLKPAVWRVIQFVWIVTPHFVSLAMTEKIKIAHAVRHMAMTIFFAITKIFNSISFRDYSLLFIKKIY